MRVLLSSIAVTVCAVGAVSAQTPPIDTSVLFGAREAISRASLSPDGTKVAFIGPAAGQGTILYAINTLTEKVPHVVLKTSGDPERLFSCAWVANDRLTCNVGGYQEYNGEIYGFSSVIAVNADGSNVKLLSKRQGENALYADFRGGGIIDYGPGADGVVMMMRTYVPEAKIGSLLSQAAQGMAVDQIDTRTLAVKKIESARREAVEYITDGNGAVRIMGFDKPNAVGYAKGIIAYSFRLKGSRDWKPLGDLDYANDKGFNPYIVDAAKDLVYGFSKVGGRKALVSLSLANEGLAQTVVLARPDVDVDGLIQIGRQQRVVGASFATERRQSVYFDADLKKLAASLGKALPNQPLIEFVDSNLDESKLLIWAGGDTSPGTYYLFDRTAKKLQPIMPARPELAGVKLASVQSVSYPATDGTMIPGYLTLPPGSSGKNLPTIVMPHAGPSSRDEWGFDWFAQYYVNRGFAVLQPNYRGSSGYGESWYKDNGFKSWRIAIGDVSDAGRWLQKMGIADPKRLFIVGWAYGGYAALQSAVLDPGLFKAVVAVAPITDLEMAKAEDRNFYQRRVTEGFIGSGPHTKEGSPAQNVNRIVAPILMFHGALDTNARIAQSRFMVKRMNDAGKQAKLVEYPNLEISLVDSKVRADMLKRSADFLLASAPK